MSKFFTFNQNNSGGSFDSNDSVAEYVIIEADSPKEANRIAEDIGIYFDGVSQDLDCACCGDRWYAQWSDEDGSDQPMIYDKNPQEYRSVFSTADRPYCHVYYKDGVKKSYKL